MDSVNQEGSVPSSSAPLPDLERDASGDEREEELDGSNIFEVNPFEMTADQAEVVSETDPQQQEPYQATAGSSVFDGNPLAEEDRSESQGSPPIPDVPSPGQVFRGDPLEIAASQPDIAVEVDQPEQVSYQPLSSVFDGNLLAEEDRPESQAPPPPAPPPPASVDESPPPKKKRKMLIAVITLLCLIGVGLVAWFFLFEWGSQSSEDKAAIQSVTPVDVVSGEEVSTLCQRTSVNLEEVGVIWFGQSLEHGHINSFWMNDQQQETSRPRTPASQSRSDNDDASIVMQQVVTDLYETDGDGCTAAGAFYWRNILPHIIDADRLGVDNFDASTRYDIYSDESEIREAVVEEIVRQLNSCVANAQFVDLKAEEQPRIYAIAYDRDYKDVVFVDTPLLELDSLSNQDQGLKVLRCTFGKTEGNNGEYVNDVLISPSLRAIVYLDRPVGLLESQVIIDEGTETGDTAGEPEEATAGDAQESAGDTEATAGDAQESAGDTEATAGDAQESAGDTEATAGDAQESAGDTEATAGDAQESAGDTEATAGDAQESAGDTNGLTSEDTGGDTSRDSATDTPAAATDSQTPSGAQTSTTDDTEDAVSDTSQTSTSDQVGTETTDDASEVTSRAPAPTDESKTDTNTAGTDDGVSNDAGTQKPDTDCVSNCPQESNNGDDTDDGSNDGDNCQSGCPGDGNDGDDDDDGTGDGGDTCQTNCPGDGDDGDGGDTCQTNCPGDGDDGDGGDTCQTNCPGDGDDGDGGDTCQTNCPGDGDDGDGGTTPTPTPTPPPQCPAGQILDVYGNCKSPPPPITGDW